MLAITGWSARAPHAGAEPAGRARGGFLRAAADWMWETDDACA
jgi:hypothetical protein